jgi:hypothetical protein
VINILFMMSANLVGFVLGLDGMKHLVRELAQTPQGEPLAFTPFACPRTAAAVEWLIAGRMDVHPVLLLVPVCGRTSNVRVSRGGEAARHRQAVLDVQHEMGSHNQVNVPACATEIETTGEPEHDSAVGQAQGA